MRNTREKQRKVAPKKAPPPAKKAIAKKPEKQAAVRTRSVPKGLTGAKLEKWLKRDNEIIKSGMSVRLFTKLRPQKKGRPVIHELESDKYAARLNDHKTYNAKRTGERDQSGRYRVRQREP